MAPKRQREAELSTVADQEARDMSRKRKFALVWAVFMIVQGLVVDVPRYDRPHPVFLCACGCSSFYKASPGPRWHPRVSIFGGWKLPFGLAASSSVESSCSSLVVSCGVQQRPCALHTC